MGYSFPATTINGLGAMIPVADAERLFIPFASCTAQGDVHAGGVALEADHNGKRLLAGFGNQQVTRYVRVRLGGEDEPLLHESALVFFIFNLQVGRDSLRFVPE